MSVTTIPIPDKHLPALRESLLAARRDFEADPSCAELDRLLAQVDSAVARGGLVSLTGSTLILWRTLYDTMCLTAERLVDECNEFWRRPDPTAVRPEIANLATGLDLLESLGPPDERGADPSDT